MKFNQLLEYAVSPLFHSVELRNAAHLFKSETLYIPKERPDVKYDEDSITYNTISFTRDIRHPFFGKGDSIILSFDKNKLRHKYKLTPYIGDWIFVTKQKRKSNFYSYKESEERVVKSIPNFGKYLINILLTDEIYDVYTYHKEHLKSLKKLQKTENPNVANSASAQIETIRQNLPWVNALRNFSQKYNVPIFNYDPPAGKRALPRKELGLSKRSTKMYEEMLEEEQVMSSWIFDLTYDPDEESVLMTLLNGRNYTIYDIDEDTYYNWINSPSKGKFWHEYIRDYYQVL